MLLKCILNRFYCQPPQELCSFNKKTAKKKRCFTVMINSDLWTHMKTKHLPPHDGFKQFTRSQNYTFASQLLCFSVGVACAAWSHVAALHAASAHCLQLSRHNRLKRAWFTITATAAAFSKSREVTFLYWLHPGCSQASVYEPYLKKKRLFPDKILKCFASGCVI